MPPKKSKDPNKPKGRMSPYAFFVQERRAMYRQKNQEVKFTEFSRECATLWKGMNDEKKGRFVEKADADRERYRSEMADYKPPAGTGRGGKKKKDPAMPKRALSAFFFFCGDKRPKLKEQNPQATVGDIAKQLGAAWKIMTKEQKAPYEEQAVADKKRFARDMEKYRKGEFASGAASPEEEDDEEEDEDEESD